VVNVLEANGYDVVPTCYIGDWGGDVAKAVWGFNTYVGEEEIPVEERSARLQETYTKASQQVKEDEAARKEVSGVLAAIEGKEEPWAGIYKKTRQWSLDEFKSVFAEMKVRPVKWYYESEVDKEARELVHSMLTDGVAKKSEGAVVVEFEDDTLPTFLILKSDGTAVYSTWDLVLAQKKEQDYAPDRQLIITDNRQDLHFRQVFATLKKLGFQKVMHHLSYDIVALPDGAMSSRAGRIVTYKDVRDEWVEELIKQTQERHEDWSEKQVAATAKTLALGALAFMMLRQDANSIIKYDAKEAMSFDGFTAPYLLYTVARIHSLEKKVKTKVPKQLTLEHPLEQRLARKLAIYPAVVEKAGKTYNVAQIATWAFELAKMFSEYYHEVRIAEDEDKLRQASRMALMKAVRQGLTNALTLLGIETLEEM
jgi:arginyl-tRNA synthetase